MPDLDLRDTARDIPLAIQRVLDLARALAMEPDVLLLDEMTAALPANLAERVMEVVRDQGKTGRSVIFISHRFVEISAICDRATVLRDGETVGVVDIAPGVEEKIVELMLGRKDREEARGAAPAAATGRPTSKPRVSRAQPAASAPSSRRLVRPPQRRGRGRRRARRPGAGRAVRRARRLDQADRAAPSRSTAQPVKFSHPRDAIERGLAYVPGDRSEALLMHRSVRENIALPFSGAVPPLGADQHGPRARNGGRAPSSGCRSTRARSARCSGSPAATSRR